MSCFAFFLLMCGVSAQIFLAIMVSWGVCAIITKYGGFTSDPKKPAYRARTDARISVLNEAKWFRFPYPGKRETEGDNKKYSLFITTGQTFAEDIRFCKGRYATRCEMKSKLAFFMHCKYSIPPPL